MRREGEVYYNTTYAGVVWQDDEGYGFQYAPGYLKRKAAQPLSLTLPLQAEPFTSRALLPFFDGLIPEGWLLQLGASYWKLERRDRMGLLLALCHDCIGAVSVRPTSIAE
ncbi:MAG: HipA N-terminal domain-containing protein [Bacteroidia bacterium]|nr:HipA N-terminal domain-containing protein [Bacteroidia bacterium]